MVPRPPLLRPGLLDAAAVLVAGGGELGDAVASTARALGADVTELSVDPWGGAVAAPDGEYAQLVWDGDAALRRQDGTVRGVLAALDGAWLAIRAAAPERAGQVVLLGPRPGDAHAEAARAGLENLARTLSIEWARLGVRTVAIWPGADTPPETVAELCAFLASPAGAYHSGSLLVLDGAG